MPYGLLVFQRTEWNIKPRFNREVRSQYNSNSDVVNQSIEEVQYSGVMTAFAKKRLRRAIQLMVAISLPKEAQHFKTGKYFKFRVNFITLTLPFEQGEHTDKSIKSLALDPWIKRMKRKRGLKSYVWRAEKQANGNLHFHIITDTWIHYQAIRDDWNECLQRFGYIDKFQERHGHRNPNSTDVHAVWRIKNLAAYFVKYMSKNSKGCDVINGKLWDCSENLKVKDACEVLLEGTDLERWDRSRNVENARVIDDPNFSIVFLDGEGFEKIVTGDLREKWTAYLKRIREYERPQRAKPSHSQEVSLADSSVRIAV